MPWPASAGAPSRAGRVRVAREAGLERIRPKRFARRLRHGLANGGAKRHAARQTHRKRRARGKGSDFCEGGKDPREGDGADRRGGLRRARPLLAILNSQIAKSSLDCRQAAGLAGFNGGCRTVHFGQKTCSTSLCESGFREWCRPRRTSICKRELPPETPAWCLAGRSCQLELSHALVCTPVCTHCRAGAT